MAQDRWTDVRSKVEGLGLKLKLHLEQEDDDADERRTGSTKENLENLGERIEDAFEAFGNAARDPAVKADVKDLGLLLKDALRDTFSEVGAEVGDSLRTAREKMASSDEATPRQPDGPAGPFKASDTDTVQDSIDEGGSG